MPPRGSMRDSHAMGRLVLALISLGVIMWIAYTQLTHTRGIDGKSGTPQRALENVRVKAKEIEANDQQRADDVMNKARSAEQQ